ncbi:50S ribosomal protein L2 [Candidatus Pacearchaeota archaeon]|nr:50S ribosomal protein L2 [Candidatus Pacearchaeota archaeon]
MGKRIIVQARGHGSPSYRVPRKIFSIRLKYPGNLAGEGKVIKLLNSPAHTAPLAKVSCNKGIFFMPAFKGMIEGQTINFDGKNIDAGNIMRLGDLPVKTEIYNIESSPGDGGVFIKTGGSFATINKIMGKEVFVLMPSKKEKGFNPNCRAVVGVIAGSGRLEKPAVKAGKMFYIKKAKNKLWPRTSAIKMNAIDHPFGSGRGKNPKSKIAKRNAPPGAKVGHLRPSRTGKKR